MFALYLPELFPTGSGRPDRGSASTSLAPSAQFVPSSLHSLVLQPSASLPRAAALTAAGYAVGLAATWFGPGAWRKPLTD